MSRGDALLVAGPDQEKFLLTEYNKQKGSLRTQAPGSFIYWAAKRRGLKGREVLGDRQLVSAVPGVGCSF